MSSIVLKNVDFHYESPLNEVFQDLSLLIDTGWRTALVGRNGQGKTTLLNLLTGALSPQSGSVAVPVATRLFPFPVDQSLLTIDVVKDSIGPFRKLESELDQLSERSDQKSLLAYDDLHEQYINLNGYQIEGRIESEFAAMGLVPSLLNRPFDTLSGGEQTRALIISLFVNDHVYPLIDEPTNHLDMQGRQQLLNYLATKKGFLLVSHDRYFLDGVADHVISINKQDVRINRGNFSQWRQHMDEQLLNEQRTRDNIEREVKQLDKAAQHRRRGAETKESQKYGTGAYDKGFIGHRAAKQMKKAVGFEKRINDQLEQKKGLLKNKEKEYQLKIQTQQRESASLITLQNISIQIEDRKLLDNFSLTVSPGDRIAVTGPNGCGKTTLFNAICGDINVDEGIVSKPGFITISRSFQQPLWSDGDLREKLEVSAFDETRFRQLMGVVGLRGDVFDRSLSTFSQGQLKKIDLIRSLMIEADVLLWDEPLNYVDLYSREQVETAILASEPTILFIEHDRQFVEKVATQTINLVG